MVDELEIDIPYAVARSMVRIADEASYDQQEHGLDADLIDGIERMGDALVAAFADDRAALNTLFGVAPRDNTAVTITVAPEVLTAYLTTLDALCGHEGIYTDEAWYVAETLIENAGEPFDVSGLDFDHMPIELPPA